MPKANYRIEFTAKAIDNLDKIYKYIAEELFSPQTAIALDEEIMSKISRLSSFPNLYGYVEELSLKERFFRKLVYKNLVILYKVDENKKLVTVYTIRSCKENYLEYV